MNLQKTFTVAQIAAVLGITSRAVRDQLDGIVPAAKSLISGNEAKTYTLEQLPARLRERLAIEVGRRECTMEVLLALPRRQWQPPIALGNIAKECFDQAEKLREALKPFLTAPRDPILTAEEWKQRGADYYLRVFKVRITTHHWDRLFRRTEKRDNGVQNFDALLIYLPARLKRKSSPAAAMPAGHSKDFAGLETLLCAIKAPGQPDKDETVGIWNLALTTVQKMVQAGELEKRAARRVRQFLFARAAFLAPTKDALWIAFKRKIAALKRAGGLPEAIADRRAGNGPRVEIAPDDIARLQWSVSHRNGGSVDAAWREEYPALTESTRQRYEYSFSAPAKIHELLNREIVDAITARHEGKRQLRRMMPKLRRDWTGVPSMHSWVVDDKTSDVECALKNRDGSVSLIRPQIIAVMDSASRKFVGWTVSVAKAPNARIVCDAVKTGFRIHGVPKRIGVENGFVFGKSALVNGKEDEFGQTLVVGLGHFGCELDHFEKMNPTSKSELEYGFRQLDRLMERWPGYGGPIQMLSDFEDFKRQKVLIEAGKADATQFRMTFDEFIVEFKKVVLKYNATPQQGRLKGLSPDDAFVSSKDQNNPPINLNKLDWLLSDRQLVHIGIGGAKFTYRATREKIHVIGGELVNFVGQELWALMDPRDTSIVTFMNRDFTRTFTMDTSEEVHARQKDFDPGSETQAKERAKIREHERAISEKYLTLQNQFGNPRRDMLVEIRKQPAADNVNPTAPPVRVAFVSRRMDEAGKQMQQQRAEITAAKEQKNRRAAANKSKARKNGIPAVMADESEQFSRGAELLQAGSRAITDEISIEETEA